MGRSNLSDLESRLKEQLDRLDCAKSRDRTGYAHGSGGGGYNERISYGAASVGGYVRLPVPDDSSRAELQGIIRALEECASDCEDNIQHQQDELRKLQIKTGDASAKPAKELHEAERAIRWDLAVAEKLQARFGLAILETRNAMSHAQSSGINNPVSSVATPGYQRPPTAKSIYVTPSMLDETMYLLKAQPVSGQSDLVRSLTVPYLTNDSKARNGSITDKVKLGGGQIAAAPGESYGLPPRYEGPEPPGMDGLLPHVSGPYSGDPNDPTQKANYDRQRGLLNY